MSQTRQARKNAKRRTEIGADEARQKLGDYLDRAGYKGERFVFSRHGKPPFAALISIDDLTALENYEAA